MIEIEIPNRSIYEVLKLFPDETKVELLNALLIYEYTGEKTGSRFIQGVIDAIVIDAKDKAEYTAEYIVDGEIKNRRVQLLLQPSTAEGLKAAATKQGISFNELANNIFKEYLRKCTINSDRRRKGRR
jgi:hypothetical protein